MRSAARASPTRCFARRSSTRRRSARSRQLPWKAAAHITGGGLVENPPRFFADDSLAVELDPTTWEVPAIMKLIAIAGVDDEEMRRTFNMGLGMIIVVSARRSPTKRCRCSRDRRRASSVARAAR